MIGGAPYLPSNLIRIWLNAPGYSKKLSLLNLEDLDFTYIRKIVKELISCLDKDFKKLRDGPVINSSIMLKQNLHLLEDFEQVVEAKENVPQAIDDPEDPHRWFETDPDNAGYHNEKVLYRTSVDAQLGSKDDRQKSSNAPYMLLLWTTAVENDIFISLCNQRGTVNLCRKVTVDDLEKVESAEGMVPFGIDFPSQEAEIKLLSPRENQDFIAIPKKFFAGIRERGARPGELVIYQNSLRAYNLPQRHATYSTFGGMTSSKHSSCGISVYESLSKRCWETTRRLVISSAPGSPKPSCVSHWLPADQIRITVEGSKATIAWSDCGQLEKIGDGKFGYTYSFVYKPENPNRKIHLEFSNHLDAQTLEECLLFPTEISPNVSLKFKLSSPFQDARVYRLFDEEEPERQYHSIAVADKSPRGPHMTQMFYVYRDLDWILKISNDISNVIDFPCLQTSSYVSTKPRLHGEPIPTDTPPEFNKVTEKLTSARVRLGCIHDLARFMEGLTGWRLKFFQCAPKVVLSDSGHLIKNTKEVFKMVGVQLWEKASETSRSRTQLAIRLDGQMKEPWITASLHEVAHGSRQGTNRFTSELLGLTIQRGIAVDTKFMTATSRTQDQQSARKRWKIAMTFEEMSGQ